MQIARLTLRNYKSFDESPELTFTSGFNVIAGQNNTGKTALLEVLSLGFSANPHRSLRTLPTRYAILDPVSSAEISVTLERDELVGILAAIPGDRYIALPAYPTEFTAGIGYSANDPESTRKLVEHVLSRPEHTFSASLRQRRPESWLEPFSDPFKRPLPGTTAERLNVGECRFGPNTHLAPNAANLAEVLNCLQQNPVRFVEFNRLVHQILPQVQQITVRPMPNDTVQIIVWPHDPRSEREDIAIPLNQCGTGIGQVLAILYVAVHAPFPRVILIDEPQSFLHPGAVRKLIEVLANYRQHQFIISTHSPTVISAADPENIIVTRLDSGVSRADQVHPRDSQALQSFLSEIGVHLSDVFGADNILWVEGRTEEICFPLILRELAKKPLMETAILGVRRTGDLETKDAARIFEIYDSLATSGTLSPPAIGFILDSECRTPNQVEDIKKRSNGSAVFLGRRMYENYLLNPVAIAHVATAIEGFRKEPVTPEEVVAAITTKRTDRKYYCSADPSEMSEENWVKRIHAAVLLSDVFSELSENRVAYDKVVHGVELARWLIQHSPDDLREVADLLTIVVDRR